MPERLSFICPGDFVYRKETILDITSTGQVIWETVYEQEEWEIEAIRDEILTYPVLYY